MFNVYRLNFYNRRRASGRRRREGSLGDPDHPAGQAAAGVACLLALVVAPSAQVISLLVDLEKHGDHDRYQVVTFSPTPKAFSRNHSALDRNTPQEPVQRLTFNQQ